MSSSSIWTCNTYFQCIDKMQDNCMANRLDVVTSPTYIIQPGLRCEFNTCGRRRRMFKHIGHHIRNYMDSDNERRRCIVASSFIGSAHTQNDASTWICMAINKTHGNYIFGFNILFYRVVPHSVPDSCVVRSVRKFKSTNIHDNIISHAYTYYAPIWFYTA